MAGDLGVVASIDEVVVTNRNGCCGNRLKNFRVFVSDVPFLCSDIATTLAQPGVFQWHFPGTATAGQVFTVPVNRSGRYVRVQLGGIDYLHLASVEVMGSVSPGVPTLTPTPTGTPSPTLPPTPGPGVNIAVGRPATQSSTYFGNGASRAADGNTNGNYGAGSVAVTLNDVEAWWQVDLGAVRPIAEVRVWNRTDCCSDRLKNFWLLASNDALPTDLDVARAQVGVLSAYQPGIAPVTTTVPVNRSARYVRVQLSGQDFLQLAEVEVITPSSATREISQSHVINTVVVNYLPMGTTIPLPIVLKGPAEHAAYQDGAAHFDCAENAALCPPSDPSGAMVKDYLERIGEAAENAASFLTEATRYRASQVPPPAPAPSPSLEFNIVDTITILQPKISGGANKCTFWPENDPAPYGEGLLYNYTTEGGYPRGNFNRNDGGINRWAFALPYVFDAKVDLCSYVKDRNVRFVLLQNGFSRSDQIVESLSAGKYGNVGNSGGHLGLYCRDGKSLPLDAFAQADATYHVYLYGARKPEDAQFPTGAHEFIHHLEAVIGRPDDATLLNNRRVFGREYRGLFTSGFDGTERSNQHRFGTDGGLGGPPPVGVGQCRLPPAPGRCDVCRRRRRFSRQRHAARGNG